MNQDTTQTISSHFARMDAMEDAWEQALRDSSAAFQAIVDALEPERDRRLAAANLLSGDEQTSAYNAEANWWGGVIDAAVAARERVKDTARADLKARGL